MTAGPEPVIPVPASMFSRLRGRRVVVGIPGVGFRGDLRSDDPVANKGRTYVPVLSEHDYYRSESQGIETFATLVPIERTWVETVASLPFSRAEMTALDAPPPRIPVPLSLGPHGLGARVVHKVADGFVRDLRTVTGAYGGPESNEYVRICGEAEWYLWILSGDAPRSEEVPVTSLWLE
jgi:hypothetical protein